MPGGWGSLSALWDAVRVEATLQPHRRRRPGRDGDRLVPVLPIPEVARLGRTLRAWRQVLADFSTDGVSNGGTEAINGIIEKTRRIGRGYRNCSNPDYACCSPQAATDTTDDPDLRAHDQTEIRRGH